MPEILYIFKVRIEKPHQFNHTHRLRLPYIVIFYRYNMVNHLLNMSAIFPHDQLISQ